VSLGNEMEPTSTAGSSRVARTPGQDVRHRSSGASVPKQRWSRRRGVSGVFAALAALGFAGAYLAPAGAALAESAPEGAVTTSYSIATEGAQSLQVDEAISVDLVRDSYSVYVKPKPTPTPTPTPRTGSGTGTSASVARPFYTGGGSKTDWLIAAGIAESDWAYVDYIVTRESGWNPNATNKSSGACGLVQALPCSKVPGNGYDPVDNLRWANGYAQGRYGSWAGAYDFWVSRHWW